jgi:hypothetical protein
MKSKNDKICCEKGEEGGQKMKRAAQGRAANTRLRKVAVAKRERNAMSQSSISA